MKMTLPRFYLLFMLVSFGLFSIEDKMTSKENKEVDSKRSEVIKEEVKSEKIIKRPYRHYYRYSNLC